MENTSPVHVAFSSLSSLVLSCLPVWNQVSSGPYNTYLPQVLSLSLPPWVGTGMECLFTECVYTWTRVCVSHFERFGVFLSLPRLPLSPSVCVRACTRVCTCLVLTACLNFVLGYSEETSRSPSLRLVLRPSPSQPPRVVIISIFYFTSPPPSWEPLDSASVYVSTHVYLLLPFCPLLFGLFPGFISPRVTLGVEVCLRRCLALGTPFPV